MSRGANQRPGAAPWTASAPGDRRAAVGPDGERFWDLDHIELTTVGIDIGSSTSHLTFSRLHLQRLGERLSSRYVPVERRILHESRIIFTPYLQDDTIDAETLALFVQAAYAQAGIDRTGVDSGAVILTGEAVKRRNARAISERLAEVAGDFVCATAGPRLEAMIAAHGSGAVARSRESGGRVLNVDIGGGTTKFALVEDGVVATTAAIAVGGRLIAHEGGRVSRSEPAGRWIADRLGIRANPGDILRAGDRRRLGEAMAGLVVDEMLGTNPVPEALMVTSPLAGAGSMDAYVFSGGVAEYVYRRQVPDFGDLGPEIGSALRFALKASGVWRSVVAPAETIRATVIGASQYTLQVSGNTVTVTEPSILPVRNLRVVAVTTPTTGAADADGLSDLLGTSIDRAEPAESDEPLAFAIRWRGRPFHPRLHALARAIVDHAPAAGPLVLVFDSDVGRSVGAVLRTELGWTGPLVCLDGIDVGEFDFIDIGTALEPSGTYPVVVKTLVFPVAGSRRPKGAIGPG